MEQLPTGVDTLIKAVRAGELNAILDQARMDRRRRRRRSKSSGGSGVERDRLRQGGLPHERIATDKKNRSQTL